MLVGLINTGCKSKEGEIKKIRDLDFTVVDDEDIPGELKEIIDEKKKTPLNFHILIKIIYIYCSRIWYAR